MDPENDIPVEEEFIDLGTDLEAEDPPETDPVVEDTAPPATFNPADLDDQALLAEVTRRTHLLPASTTPAPADDPLKDIREIDRLSLSNDENDRLKAWQMLEDRATARVRQEVQSRIAPITEREALAATGLTETGQGYLRKLSKDLNLDTANVLSNPQFKDVLTRAAKDYERENAKVNPPTHINSGSESGVLTSAEEAAAREFRKIDPDFKFSRESLAEFRNR